MSHAGATSSKTMFKLMFQFFSAIGGDFVRGDFVQGDFVLDSVDGTVDHSWNVLITCGTFE